MEHMPLLLPQQHLQVSSGGIAYHHMQADMGHHFGWCQQEFPQEVVEWMGSLKNSIPAQSARVK